MVRPAIPILTYYIDYDYIVAELCENKDKPILECNGKCHLAKEIKKINNGLDTKKEIPPLNMKEYPVSPLFDDNIITENKEFKKNTYSIDLYINLFNGIFIVDVFHPPQSFC